MPTTALTDEVRNLRATSVALAGDVRALGTSITALRKHADRRIFRAALLVFIMGLIALAAAISVALYVSSTQHAASVKSCQDRVNISKQVVSADDLLLAKSVSVKSDPIVQQFLLSSRDASLRASQVHCG